MRASAIWPIRHLAITGIDTASMISLIILGSAIRATPPVARMSAGTRSSAITATAPDSSAVTASLGVVTSMITPPFCILAKPRLTRSVPYINPSKSSSSGMGQLYPLYHINVMDCRQNSFKVFCDGFPWKSVWSSRRWTKKQVSVLPLTVLIVKHFWSEISIWNWLL